MRSNLKLTWTSKTHLLTLTNRNWLIPLVIIILGGASAQARAEWLEISSSDPVRQIDLSSFIQIDEDLYSYKMAYKGGLPHSAGGWFKKKANERYITVDCKERKRTELHSTPRSREEAGVLFSVAVGTSDYFELEIACSYARRPRSDNTLMTLAPEASEGKAPQSQIEDRPQEQKTTEIAEPAPTDVEARERHAFELEAIKEREARLQAELALAKLKLALQEEREAAAVISNKAENPTSELSAEQVRETKKSLVSNQRLALVIGNDSYKNVPKLENAVGDAKAISGLLSGLGYQVLTFNNLNEKEFKRSLRQFKQRLKGGEEVVFFFAGHGVQIGSANYLLPTDVGSDSEDQIQDEGIPLQRVLDDFSESKVKFSLAMVDACRDNPFKSTGRSIGGRGLAATSAATGQMVIFSAGVGQQALDRLGNNDKARNGLFTRVLIDKVSQSKEPIHILMRDVREEVAALAQSVGHQQVPAIYDQVIGNFYFVPKK